MFRLALLGLGKVAEEIHLPALGMLDAVEVVAGCDPDPARQAVLRRFFSGGRAYADATELLEREHPDLVLIGTPPTTHFELCRHALEAGSHVFCEKPFVPTVGEADELIRLAGARGLSVAVNNEYRYLPIYQKAKEYLGSPECGQPYLIQCWQQMCHPPSTERNWRADLSEYLLFEFGTHPIDLFCYFFDALPESVTAALPRPPHELQTDVAVQAALRFPGQRVATLVANRMSQGAERYMEMRVDCERASLRLSFGGLARAAAHWSRTARRPVVRLSLVRGGEARVEAGGRSRLLASEQADGRARATAAHLREVLGEIRSGASGVSRATHARELIRIVRAGYDAAASGEAVRLREEGN